MVLWRPTGEEFGRVRSRRSNHALRTALGAIGDTSIAPRPSGVPAARANAASGLLPAAAKQGVVLCGTLLRDRSRDPVVLRRSRLVGDPLGTYAVSPVRAPSTTRERR